MMNDSSKRHSQFLSLIFILNCLSEALVIRILKRDNQLNLFRRLEQLSIKQLNCDGAIEFLRLCQNFGLTPTFTKIDETKSKKWKQSSKQSAENVIHEELRMKSRQNVALKKQINEIYDEIRQKCSSIRYLYILKTIVLLRKKKCDKMMSGHISKIARMLRRDVDVEEHILNISSHQLISSRNSYCAEVLSSPFLRTRYLLWRSKPILKRPTGN